MYEQRIGAAEPHCVGRGRLGLVDFQSYAHAAAKLVNTELPDLAAARAFLAAEGWPGAGAGEGDLAAMRQVQRRLRESFTASVAGREAEVVAELNALLEVFPIRPRITRHGDDDWHVHLACARTPVGAEYAASAVWGLTVWLCTFGLGRFGVCAHESCRNVYLDRSSTLSRRFCSERCATRFHAVSHRRRKKSAAARRPSGEPGQT